MVAITKKIRFDNSGYYFIGLPILVLLGFWDSYFSKLFPGTNDYNFYFHFHAVIMTLWVLVLIIQPILIRKKELALHKVIGKLSYIVMPLLFISVILLTHVQLQKRIDIVNGEISLSGPSPHLLLPFKDLLILGIMYIIAIVHRRDVNIHARAMIATGIVFIEPALSRFLIEITDSVPVGFLTTIGLVYTILIALMVVERKQKKGRWVFPLVLSLYIFVHSLLIFQVQIGFWETFAKWFAGLPLT
ncbi:hypothetical protein [uncultured Fibrella sp.]|uniref:hypothetical protein n=1 Tax=uncultured Fibrella sp. TaxID=1284596 RepID=UPI0035CAF1C0